MRKTPNNILHIFIHFFIIFFLAYNSVVFQRICRKLVTVRKILKRSLKWDQSGIYSFIRLKDTSKTRLTVFKNAKILWLVPHEGQTQFYAKSGLRNIWKLVNSLYHTNMLYKTAKHLSALLISTPNWWKHMCVTIIMRQMFTKSAQRLLMIAMYCLVVKSFV